MNALIDGFGRRITYARLSVTDRCDLRCRYCMPEKMRFLPRRDLLSLGELERLADGLIARGVTRLRLTGGEPLVRRGVMDLVRALGSRIGDGLDELTLTTNGTQLEHHADALAAAGVKRVNVSLDTLDRDMFAALTRRDALPAVLRGIAAARGAGLAVKINTVALAGVNEHALPDMVAWAHDEGHSLSLIEVMPMGEVEAARTDQFLPLTAVREALEQRFTLVPCAYRTGGPARYYEVPETGGRIGLISPLTQNFCASCNRIRITATGQLYACLGGREQVDLRAALRGGSLDAALDLAMAIKPERHMFEEMFAADTAVERHMSATGG